MRYGAGLLIAAVLAVSVLAAGCGSGLSKDKNGGEGAPMEISKRIKIDISGAQTFNDTNRDGYGEFEGWGTSLCWWANRLPTGRWWGR